MVCDLFNLKGCKPPINREMQIPDADLAPARKVERSASSAATCQRIDGMDPPSQQT